MSILTYTIAPERLAQIEQAVGFKIKVNRDMDYALELLILRGRRKAVGMNVLAYTITPERLTQIEQAVGFKIEDNHDMNYALEQLVKNAWDK